MGLSIRQISLQYGLNPSHIRRLTHLGILHVSMGTGTLRPIYTKEVVDSLIEGDHFVVCLICGSWQGQMTDKHLRSCSGVGLQEYAQRYPHAPIMCSVVVDSRRKTEQQKAHQSKVLRDRFNTPEGVETRMQISRAAQRLMSTGYRQRASAHLSVLNASPERRLSKAKEMKARWDSGVQRDLVEGWHRDNPEQSQANIARARTHIKDPTMLLARSAIKVTSMLHLGFKEMLLRHGVQGFQTEGVVGPYRFDEVNYNLKMCVEIDGCYWHGCVECGFRGVSNTLVNDRRKTKYIHKAGWTLVRIPEHMIHQHPEQAIGLVLSHIESQRMSYGPQSA